MIRFVTATTVAGVLLATTGTPFAQSVDAPPSQPGNFRATLYSNAGGELFWQRSSDDRGAVRGYEITRNGESLGIRDALSFYDPSLLPDVPYVFTVVAIDNAGQRSAVATTTLGGGTAPPPVEPPADDAPPAPQALRAAVYSRTALELFWRREPAALRLRYEIRRDGRLVGTTNGVSFYSGDLPGGADHDFEVIAIGLDGNRSRASTITVRADGGTGPTPVTPPPPSLATPTNLRSAVYSATAAELFWDRASTPRLRYEIRRDGELVTTTNGTSFFDNSLASGARHVYTVVALDRQGARSAPATIVVATAGDAAEPRFLDRSWREVADAAVAILDGVPSDDVAARVTSVAIDVLGAPVPTTELGPDRRRRGETDDTLACPRGGTLRSRRSIDQGFEDSRDDDDYLFARCILSDGTRLEGRLRRSTQSNNRGPVFDRVSEYAFTSFVSSEGGTLSRIDGSSRELDRRDVRVACGDELGRTDAITAVLPLPTPDGGPDGVLDRATLSRLQTDRTDGQALAVDGVTCDATEAFDDRATVQLGDGRTLVIERRGERRSPAADQSLVGDYSPSAVLRVAVSGTSDVLTVRAVADVLSSAVQVVIDEGGASIAFPDTFEWRSPAR